MQRRFEPAQLIQGTVRIRNTGNLPANFAVRVTPGASGVLGFSPEATSRTVLTPRTVGPGDTVALPVSIRLPEAAGSKAFRVEVGEVSPAGLLTRVFDSQVFNNLADVVREVAIVPPGPPAPPPTLTPSQLASQFMEGLGPLSLSVNPKEVNPGQSVRATIQVPNSAPAAFSPQLRLALLDANNQPVRTVFDQRLSVPRGIPIARQVDVSTAGLASGDYGLRPFLIDPISNLVLANPGTFANAFRVLAAVAPPAQPPAPPVTEPVALIPAIPPTPAPEPVISGPVAPQLVTVGTPTLTPTSVAAGGRITGTWTVRNTRGQRIRAFLFLDGPGGGNGVARDIDPGEAVTLSVIGQVPAGQRAGSVTYGLAVRDVNTNRTIGSLVRAITLNVPAPVPATSPTPSPVPTPPAPTSSAGGIRPGQLVMSPPTAQPLTVARTQQTNLLFSVSNQSGVSATLNVLAFPKDPNGRTRATLRASVPVRASGSIPFQLSYLVPQDAAPGPWGVQVFIWDSRTFVPGNSTTYLIQQTFPGVFRVR